MAICKISHRFFSPPENLHYRAEVNERIFQRAKKSGAKFCNGHARPRYAFSMNRQRPGY